MDSLEVTPFANRTQVTTTSSITLSMRNSLFWWLQRRNLLTCPSIAPSHRPWSQLMPAMLDGGPLQIRAGAGQMGSPPTQHRLEYPGTTSSLLHPSGLQSPPKRKISIAKNEKHHSSFLCEETRGDAEFYLTPRSRANHFMGPEESGQHVSSLSPRSPEYPGSLFVPGATNNS